MTSPAPFQTIKDTELTDFANTKISLLPVLQDSGGYEVAWFEIVFQDEYGDTTRELKCSFKQANDMLLAVMERAAARPYEVARLGVSTFWNHVAVWAKLLRRGSTGGHSDRPEFM